jgi:hypothetical protein
MKRIIHNMPDHFRDQFKSRGESLPYRKTLEEIQWDWVQTLKKTRIDLGNTYSQLWEDIGPRRTTTFLKRFSRGEDLCLVDFTGNGGGKWFDMSKGDWKHIWY